MLENKYFLWGAGTYGARLIEYMKNDLSFVAVIDNDPQKQVVNFQGLPVIGYDEAKEYLPETKIVVSNVMPHEVRNFLIKESYIDKQDFYTIYDFLPRYFGLKNRLVASHANMIATTACNIKCEACQSYIPYAAGHRHINAESIISNVDLMFNHIDSFMNINFPCGESLLNSKLPEVCKYIYEKYKGRYYIMVIKTNGTVIPKDDAMRCFAGCKTVFSISDYDENITIKKKVTEKCDEFGVRWYNNSACVKDKWYDFGDSRIITETIPGKLRERYKKCWIPGAGIYEGWLYLCTVQSWSHAVVKAGSRESGDVFDLRQPKNETSREELYRIISRQPEHGYISHCMRCNGTMPITK